MVWLLQNFVGMIEKKEIQRDVKCLVDLNDF